MDNPLNTAFNEFAPTDERTDALTGLQKAHMPTDSELLPKDALQELIGWVDQELTLQKAISPDDVPYPSYASKHGKPGMQSVQLDDYQASYRGDYWERPSIMTFDQLRSMAFQTPVLNAVVMTRTRQVQRFCRISEKDTTLPGFEIRHIDRKHALTSSESKKIEQLQQFIANCGFEFSARKRKKLHRDSFSQFMGKATRDSLILDSVAVETEMRNDKSLGIDGFYLVDGATIRLCSEAGYLNDPEIYAVQVVSGLIRTAYTYDDLIYEARNPRADVTCAGYGMPETELLIKTVTGFLNAMTLNNNVFDKNSIPKGILHLAGNYSDDDLKAFKRYWQSMVKGVSNAFAMPVLVSKDQDSKAQFEKFGVEFNEMMFAKWMTFLTSLICAIYGMSPSEINFDSFTGGSTSALSGSDTAEKLAASKDSGLRPLLSYFENLWTDYVISEFDDKLCFRWTGLDPEDDNKKFELRKTVLTVNELRAEEGYKVLETPLGDAPVNPALLNAWMQLKAQEESEQQAGNEGGDANTQPDDGDDSGKDILKKAFDGSHELMLKALGDDDLFRPHPNPFIRGLVEDYSQSNMIRISGIRTALDEWLEGKRYIPGAGVQFPPFSAIYQAHWLDAEIPQIEAYLSSIPPVAFSVSDMSLLAKLLVRQSLPEGVLIDEAINQAAQSFVMGAAQSAWQSQHPDVSITDAQVGQLRAALPNALEGVIAALRMSTIARATLDYGAARAAENIVQLTDDARGKIQSVLMDHQLRRLSGDESATTTKLQQTLFDKFADMNRDWRRIALTEAGEMSGQGFVATLTDGEKVKRLEREDACPYCQKINGMVATVVDPNKLDKDGQNEIWVGKTNIGRSSSPNKRTDEGLEPRYEHELWWPVPGPIHPHCRGFWQKMSGNVS